MSNDPVYRSLQTQLKVVTDRVRGVARGLATGLYLYGPPGTSKTFTVRKTLDDIGFSYVYQSGRLTAGGLFSLIEDNPSNVIVLDDVSSIFRDPIAMEVLLAALGNCGGIREVRYKTARADKVVEFSGGIVAISNLDLNSHQSELLGALSDRIYVVRYEPTDDQIISLMRHVAAQGVDYVPPTSCQMVLDFLLDETQKRGIRPSMRIFVDKAIKDFQLHSRNQSELHWKDLIVSNLEQQLIQPRHSINDLSRSDRIAAERRIVEEICDNNSDCALRVQLWRERTGKSQAAFYRRLKDLEQSRKGFFEFD